MTHDAKALYKDYWKGVAEDREKRAYFERLYGGMLERLKPVADAKVLDVAGGNGHLMRYLGIRNADVLDISESGLQIARESGLGTVFADVEKRFPVPEESYDAAYCFEVLEHLYRPNKTLSEIHHALKSGGALYVAQPNMRADGVHHVRRYYPRELLIDLGKAGFRVEWWDYVPAYSMREAIVDDILHNRSPLRKAVQCVNWTLSLLPHGVRYAMAKAVPDRFALMIVVKAVKK